MNVRDLIPWGRAGQRAPALFRDEQPNPIFALHREMNRLFDDAFRSFDVPSFGRAPGWPSVEISETDKDIRVSAELPGLEEKDIEVLLADDVLTLRGEKRAEVEDKERQLSERFYGRFERRIPLGTEVEQDKVEASFKNGVLTVTLPKNATAQAKTRRIAINSSA
jgi:HSP20 family protein